MTICNLNLKSVPYHKWYKCYLQFTINKLLSETKIFIILFK